MEAPMLCMGPVFPQEIFDCIIDFGHSDTDFLRTCSLVCQAWVPSSRFHLFETIAFSDVSQTGPWLALSQRPGAKQEILKFVKNAYFFLPHDEQFDEGMTNTLADLTLDYLYISSGLGFATLPATLWIRKLSLNLAPESPLGLLKFLSSCPSIQSLHLFVDHTAEHMVSTPPHIQPGTSQGDCE
jgi:hypothetical protein